MKLIRSRKQQAEKRTSSKHEIDKKEKAASRKMKKQQASMNSIRRRKQHAIKAEKNSIGPKILTKPNELETRLTIND